MRRHGGPVTAAVPQIFDNRRRALRLNRAVCRQQGADPARWLLDAMAEDVIDRLGFLRFAGRKALVTGLGGEAVSAHLAASGVAVTAASSLDVEQPLAGGSYDAIAALGVLDTINDLPGALIHLRQALAPGGMLLAPMVGAASLPMLRQAMLAADGEQPGARIHPQVDNRAASALLQRAGFVRQVVDQYPLTARYGSLERLVADLRDQGLTSVLADRAPPLGQAALEKAAAWFAAQADAEGKTSERFEILTLTAWKD